MPSVLKVNELSTALEAKAISRKRAMAMKLAPTGKASSPVPVREPVAAMPKEASLAGEGTKGGIFTHPLSSKP